MKLSHCIVTFLLCQVVTLWWTATAPAQDNQKSVRLDPLGMEFFRHQLHRAGYRPLHSPIEIYDDPQNVLIVLVGEQSISQYLTNGVREVVKNGASILIASDKSTLNTNLFPFFSVQILGKRITADPEDSYHGVDWQPFVRPLTGRFAEGSPRIIFKGIEAHGSGAIATQEASVLRRRAWRFPFPEALASFPFSSKVDQGDFLPNVDLFAAGGAFDDGRYLILADHSIFLNQMLLQMQDNSNLDFTNACLDWLKHDHADGVCLFVEDGRVRTDFEIILPEYEEPLSDLILKSMSFFEQNGNQILSSIEDKNLFDEMLLNLVSLKSIIRMIIVFLASMLVIYLIIRMLRSRSSQDPARTLLTRDVYEILPRGDVLQQRFDYLRQSESIHEAVRDLVREYLDVLQAQPDAQGRPPQIRIEDGYNDENWLKRAVQRLWDLAYASTNKPLLASDWPILKNELRRILIEADEGWWHFVRANQTAPPIKPQIPPRPS